MEASAGRFTVPHDLLASMVPSPVLGGAPTVSLLVQHFTLPSALHRHRVRSRSISWESYSATSVTLSVNR